MAKNLLKSSDLREINKWIEKLAAREYDSDNKREVAKSNLKLPYKELSAGAHRIVYDIKNESVLKIAISKKGIQCNEFEAELYKTVKSSLKSSLAEVKEYGTGWIIMEKIEDEVPKTEANRDKLLIIHKKFSKVGINARDIINQENNEPRWHNIRYRKKDKSIIIIDYGDFEYR
ncbi:MAG: hypothetical protein K0S39_3173 [Paenibacillus sp.]|nr:hypothetical protein [Paenibacillus sp.]